MNSTEEQMTTDQSFKIIHEMINKARFNFSKGSFYFILWGFLLVGAAVYEYYFDRILHSEWAWAAWPVVGILGGIVSGIYGARSSKGEPLTHLSKIYSGIWVTYFATLALFIIGIVSNGVNPGSYIMILTGFPTFLTGLVLKYKPLQIGGVGFWVLGFLSIYLFEEYRSLIFALSIFQGYLIPGFMMRQIQRDHV